MSTLDALLAAKIAFHNINLCTASTMSNTQEVRRIARAALAQLDVALADVRARPVNPNPIDRSEVLRLLASDSCIELHRISNRRDGEIEYSFIEEHLVCFAAIIAAGQIERDALISMKHSNRDDDMGAIIARAIRAQSPDQAVDRSPNVQGASVDKAANPQPALPAVNPIAKQVADFEEQMKRGAFAISATTQPALLDAADRAAQLLHELLPVLRNEYPVTYERAEPINSALIRAVAAERAQPAPALLRELSDPIELRNLLGNVRAGDGIGISDNVSIALCSYFTDHLDRPDDDVEGGDSVWSPWVEAQTNFTLDAMARAVLAAAKAPA